MDVGRSGQRMRITRVDVATAPKPPGGIEFAAAARGSLLLPKDGQWSFCRQPADSTRECEAADAHTGVPLVREGRATVPEAANTAPYRFAEPADLLANTSGRNIALLWSTGTQRLLFSRPRIVKGSKSITSDVAPLLADPFSRVSSGALFPPALTCLRVPFANYSLEVPGESQLRLVLPSATFAAQPVSGNLRRELSAGASTRILSRLHKYADHGSARFLGSADFQVRTDRRRHRAGRRWRSRNDLPWPFSCIKRGDDPLDLGGGGIRSSL